LFRKQLAKEHGLSVDIVEGVIRSQFDYIAEKVKETDVKTGKFNNIFIQNLGRFVVIPSARAKLKKKFEDGTDNNGKQSSGSVTVRSDDR